MFFCFLWVFFVALLNFFLLLNETKYKSCLDPNKLQKNTYKCTMDYMWQFYLTSLLVILVSKNINASIFSFFLILFFFPAVQRGDQVTLTCMHFFPPFVQLQYKYLDIVVDATQQDLLVNPFQVVFDNPKLPIPPTPSLSPQAATSLFSKSMIFFSVERFICAGY